MTIESTRPRGAPQRLRRLAESADKRRAIPHKMFSKRAALAVASATPSQREQFQS